MVGSPTDGYGGALVSCSITERAEVTIEANDQLIIENRFGQTT